MLALTIREKNGEERQLIFEKEEVTIGRATGSDIVLPRSNISKRHARLVDKHDKVVIVDLRSTNGTYVNGRRITAPELLTYEDKVYIGDFVIRLSRPAEQHASQRMTAPYTASATPEAGPRSSRGPTAAVEAPIPDMGMDAGAPPMDEPRRAPARHAPPTPPPEDEEEDRTRAIMAMPDEEELPPPPRAAAAPVARKDAPPVPAPVPVATRKETAPGAPQRAAGQAKPREPAAPPKAAAARQAKFSEEPPTMSVAVPAVLKKAAQAPPPPPAEPETTSDVATADPWAEWNHAIQVVVERIEATHDKVPVEQAELIAAEAVDAAIGAQQIAQETEREALVTDVVSELVGLGPLTDTLADPTVLAVYMNGPKSVYIDRGAGVHEPNGRLFATAGSYRRTLMNLAGIPESEEIVGGEEVTLPDGSVVRVVGAGLGPEPLVVWRRAAAEVPLLPDLVAEGLIDQAHAHALTLAIADGRNVLVCGVPGWPRSALASAICSEIGLDRRVVAVGDRSEVALAHGNQARLSSRSLGVGADLVGLEPDLVLFERLDAGTAAAWVEACLALGKPVIALSPEPQPDRALRRLALLLEVGHVPASAGRGALFVGEAVDVVVSLRTQADGTVRVDKVQDCESTKDGFGLKAPGKR